MFDLMFLYEENHIICLTLNMKYRVQRNDCPSLPRIDGQCQYKMHGTHEKVHSIRFIGDKKYDFLIFGCDVTEGFVVMFLLIKFPKNN